MFWFFGWEACGILAPRPGIEPTPSALEVLTTEQPGKSPTSVLTVSLLSVLTSFPDLPQRMQKTRGNGQQFCWVLSCSRVVGCNAQPMSFIKEIKTALLLFFSCSVVSNFVTAWTTAHQTSLSFTISLSLLKVMSIELMMPSNHLIPLLLLPSIFPSIRVFSNESTLHFRWPKYWSFSFSTSPSNEYLGLISFRIECLRDSQESSPAPQFESIHSSYRNILKA